MTTDENETREQWINTAIAAYMDLFVMMQFTAVSHWLMNELTFAQARGLIILAAKQALTVSKLARLLDVGNSTASILVQQLVERGLVTRTEDQNDRRQTVIQLSEQGREIGAGRRDQRGQQWKQWLGHLSDEELSALAHGLVALQRAAHAETQSREENATENET